MYKSPQCYLPSFKSIDLLVQEKRRKIDFQDGHHGSHLGISIGTILAVFIYKSPQVSSFIPSFKSTGHLVQEKKRKKDAKMLQPSWISDQNDFSFFWCTSHLMLPTKFQVNWPFSSGEEAKNRFSRWPPQWPSWISSQNDFSYFWSTSHPDASYQVSNQLAFWFRRRREKKIFKIAAAAILDFRLEWF